MNLIDQVLDSKHLNVGGRLVVAGALCVLAWYGTQAVEIMTRVDKFVSAQVVTNENVDKRVATIETNGATLRDLTSYRDLLTIHENRIGRLEARGQ